MLKIVALYFCLTIFLVSGIGNETVSVVSKSVPNEETGTTVPTVVTRGAPIEPTESPVPSPIPTNSTTTLSPPTTITPKTTTVTPETTTITPKTTTVTPKTTTVTPKTTTTAPNTTTAAPNTTTAAPITTPAPPVTPAPAPQTGEWRVNNGTNSTCIVVKMAVQFNVSYETTDNKTVWQELTMPIDENSTLATGSCGEKEQVLNLTWHAGEDSLMIHFVKNDTIGKYAMHHMEVTLGTHEFPNITANTTMQFVHEAEIFPTKVSNSYKCARLQQLDLMRSGINKTSGWLQISNLQFQAFKTDKAANFGFPEDCSVESTDLVPIAVGCALTALVIIVLVAYLVGRRRSQARGYVSM